MKNNLFATIIVVVIIISLAIQFIQPNEIKKIAYETINKSISEIISKTTEPQPIENMTNETEVEEIEKIITSPKIQPHDKETMIEQLQIEEWIPIIVRVKSFEQLDTVINSLNKNEFKLIYKDKEKLEFSPPIFSGNATKSAIEKLKDNIYVERIYYNYPTKTTLQESISLINVDKAWQMRRNGLNITGQLNDRNITICVIDTGINYTHPGLGGCPNTDNINTAGCSKVIGGHDYDAFPDDDNPMDTNGHGTHVAGIVAANGSINGDYNE